MKIIKNKRKALFMDIDGVVVYDPGYLSKAEELRLLPKSAEALVKAQKAGYFLVFISNKGGAFKYKNLTLAGLKKLDIAFKKLLVKNGLNKKLIATYYCPHYFMSDDKIICSCRKPKSGMFTRAIKELNIDPGKSVVIGDKISDLVPGVKVGCRISILVARNQEKEKPVVGRADQKAQTLSEAVRLILHEKITA